MELVPLRLRPGDDLRGTLEAATRERGWPAAFVVSGIGSLSEACLRLAGATEPTRLKGELEILTLGGSLSPDGAHLHISVSDASGELRGGHVAPGCIVRTTAELLIARLDEWRFTRTHDDATGYAELGMHRVAPGEEN